MFSKKNHQLQLNSSDTIYCCSSLMEKADSCVYKQIFERKNYQDFKHSLEIAIKICESLKVLHDKQMAHNNIKTEKFLHFCKGNLIKISGLGFVSKYNEQCFENFVWTFQNRRENFLSEEIKKALNEINLLTGPNLLDFDFRKSDIFDLGFNLTSNHG
ncbi:Protein kinase-like domain [Pseudocohnilembus persalinus]|uniref:Protein kinase-like domain n=1 Tax=Pseudocohnilembus persalinus TaxID=266149 RepID=A0A0V0QE87_PSEPJ|nr:Protein kinase-like domain [Pseudocohnilembus persalinus]|eukprot:KRX00503.1 Protein kinase-like domain [Pseudocohnilembus persalinus]